MTTALWVIVGLLALVIFAKPLFIAYYLVMILINKWRLKRECIREHGKEEGLKEYERQLSHIRLEQSLGRMSDHFRE